MENYDAEAQQQQQQQPQARDLSKWVKDQVSSLGKKSHPDANSILSDLNVIATTATTFASTINGYAFQSDKAQLGIEITNAVTSLGNTAAEGLHAFRTGQVKNPAYIAVNVASFALSVGRTAVGLAMEEGNTKETAKFAIDIAQMATQVAKWGTKPSAKKAKGEAYDSLATEVESLRSEVASVRSALGASSTSVHTSGSTAIARAPRQSTPPTVSAGKKRAK